MQIFMTKCNRKMLTWRSRSRRRKWAKEARDAESARRRTKIENTQTIRNNCTDARTAVSIELNGINYLCCNPTEIHTNTHTVAGVNTWTIFLLHAHKQNWKTETETVIDRKRDINTTQIKYLSEKQNNNPRKTLSREQPHFKAKTQTHTLSLSLTRTSMKM